MKSIAILHAAELVTLRGSGRPRIGAEMQELGIIRDGGILVHDGLITAVGPSDEIEKQLTKVSDVVDATGRVVLPGLIDAHTHPVFAGDRVGEFEQRSRGASYEQIAASGGGIRSTVRKTRAATEDELLDQAGKHASWFLRCGTTTAEAKSGYGLSLDDELKLLRVVRRLNEAGAVGFVPTFLGAHSIPDEYRDKAADYAALVIDEMLPAVHRENLAEYCDIFCERGYFDIPTSRKILSAASALGFKLRLHADQLSNSGAAELAAELGAATADHLEQTEQRGIDAMRRASVQPVLLPGSVYALGSSRYPRGREMIDAGLAVVLATDFNPGSSPTPSLPMVMSLAATHMKMTPAESLVATTINAAHSLGRGDAIGSLDPGKRADMVILDATDYRELAYYFGVEQTHSVYIGGKLVYRG